MPNKAASALVCAILSRRLRDGVHLQTELVRIWIWQTTPSRSSFH